MINKNKNGENDNLGRRRGEGRVLDVDDVGDKLNTPKTEEEKNHHLHRSFGGKAF